ncbi:MAG TPA: hypothetical protein VM077_04300 [Candidatus Limnocylindrales bacterium]|nr:hypothetical protein [Candidatus Limnocylindrales bacterium]
MLNISKASIVTAIILFAGSSSVAFAQSIAPTASAPSAPVIRSEKGKLRSCKAKEKKIIKRSEQIVKFSTNMESKFASISAKVQEYYVTKVVPSGKTVINYEALVSGIDANKLAVDSALEKAKTDAAAFSCESGTPKEQMMVFKDDIKAVKDGLKVYRSSIKDLIVAVHSVTGEENGLVNEDNDLNPSHGPKPTKHLKKGGKE